LIMPKPIMCLLQTALQRYKSYIVTPTMHDSAYRL
jgi:hypothetical protein